MIVGAPFATHVYPSANTPFKEESSVGKGICFFDNITYIFVICTKGCRKKSMDTFWKSTNDILHSKSIYPVHVICGADYTNVCDIVKKHMPF